MNFLLPHLSNMKQLRHCVPYNAERTEQGSPIEINRKPTVTGTARRASALHAAIKAALFALVFIVSSASANTEELKLPNLGETSTSMFSSEFEHQLGRAWLSVFRSQAPTLDDPLLFDYLEDLIYRLVTHSKLEDRRIELVVVDNQTINAFAVPGGVIGVHNGLLLYAQTEDELATVLAHEIAHLSQRHFSRGVEYQQKMQPLTLAAMLASFVLLATAGGDAGIAALSATQAAAQQSALRYSRGNEQEADRIGMQTLVAADMDPHAAPAMFERMLQATRYSGGKNVPEFLRSHPLSENRIADTRNRARQYPKKIQATSLNYQLMRARVSMQLSRTPEEAVHQFKGELDGTPRSQEAAMYGLVLALTAAGRPEEARTQLKPIWNGSPERLEYIVADAEIDLAMNRPAQAAAKLSKELGVSPGNHPLTMTYAKALMSNQQPHIAEEVLIAQSKRRPGDPGLWYLLAEVQGLSGNIPGLHRARAEYFILNGNLDQAKKQLTYAKGLTKGDYLTTATINQRLYDVAELHKRMEEL
ncbi:MAG: putative Zn-dependent protease [Bacteroidia bacterium]|jgi:predicted Zn-dependent protease